MTTTAQAHRTVGTKGVPRAERERQVLDVAAEEFARVGYAVASVAAIAENAGISKPLIYGYFASKEGLFLACLRRAGSALVEAVAAEQTGTDASRALNTLAAIFRTLEPRRHDWGVLFDPTLAEGSVPHEAAREYRRRLAEMGSQGTAEVLSSHGPLDPLDASLLAQVWVGTVTSAVNWWLDHPQESGTEMAARCARLMASLQQL